MKKGYKALGWSGVLLASGLTSYLINKHIKAETSAAQSYLMSSPLREVPMGMYFEGMNQGKDGKPFEYSGDATHSGAITPNDILDAELAKGIPGDIDKYRFRKVAENVIMRLNPDLAGMDYPIGMGKRIFFPDIDGRDGINGLASSSLRIKAGDYLKGIDRIEKRGREDINTDKEKYLDSLRGNPHIMKKLNKPGKHGHM